MAAADNNLPVPVANGDCLSINQPTKAIGERRNRTTEITELLSVFIQLLFIVARCFVEPNRNIRCFSPGICFHGAAHQEFFTWHPQVAIKSLCQPTGEADMVGMHMGADNAQDRFVLHESGEQLLPGRARWGY